MKNYKIILIYTLTLFVFAFRLKNINYTSIEIPFYADETIYLYQFILHFLILLLKCGSFNEKMSQNYLPYLIRYKSKIKIYNLLIKEIVILITIITLIKSSIEFIVFHYFDIYYLLIYFLYLTFIMFNYLNLEIFFNKELSLILTGIYMSISLSIGDIIHENCQSIFLYFFLPNLIYKSRFNSTITILKLFLFLNIIIYYIGRKTLTKKDLI